MCHAQNGVLILQMYVCFTYYHIPGNFAKMAFHAIIHNMIHKISWYRVILSIYGNTETAHLMQGPSNCSFKSSHDHYPMHRKASSSPYNSLLIILLTSQ